MKPSPTDTTPLIEKEDIQDFFVLSAKQIRLALKSDKVIILSLKEKESMDEVTEVVRIGGTVISRKELMQVLTNILVQLRLGKSEEENK